MECVCAVRHEVARTVEDVLARRTRALFLDARASLDAAPGVADTPGQQWAGEVLHTAKHAGYAALHERLVAWKASLRGAQEDSFRRESSEQILC